MFVEIEKTNSHGEKGKALIRVEDIKGIKENPVETDKLYDENGNVVSETAKPKDFTLALADGMVYHIDETQYNSLKTLLTKATA